MSDLNLVGTFILCPKVGGINHSHNKFIKKRRRNEKVIHKEDP